LEERHLIFEVIYFELLKHHYLVVSVVSEEALEADGAEAVFAEGFDLLCRVNLALALYLLLLSGAHHLHSRCNSKIIIILN
jgi:hypothetical protein